MGRTIDWRLRTVLCMAIFLMFTGCVNWRTDEPAKHQTQPESSESGADLLTFTWFSINDPFNPAPWGNNDISRWVEANHKVKIQWLTSNGNARQLYNSMVVSGNLPDVMDLSRGADVDRLVQSGSLAPLDDYLDKYPNLKKYAGESTLNMLRSADGKLYQFPIWYSPPGKPKGNGGYAIELKIYRSLGSPKLETFEDLENYLRLVKQKYPQIVPLEAGQRFSGMATLYTGFGENKSRRYLIDPDTRTGMGAYPLNGHLVSVLDDPDFKPFIAFVNRLYRDKLITQDGFTQTKDQYLEKLNKGRAAVVVSDNIANEAAVPNAKLKAIDPDDGYKVIWPLHKAGIDPAKVTPSSYDQLGWGVNVITTKARDPVRIFAFLDWMTGEEGQRIFWYGPPGLLYDEVDDQGVPLPNERFKNATIQDLKKLNVPYLNLVGNTMYIDRSKVVRDNRLPPDKRDFTIQAQSLITWPTSKNVTEFVNLDPLPDSSAGIIAQHVKDIYMQYFVRMVFAPSEEDVLHLLNQAQAEMAQAGFGELLDWQTNRWHENLKQLNNR